MVVYGKQVCLYILTHHKDRVKSVYIAKKGILPQPLFEEFGVCIKFLEAKWADSMSKGGNHQGLLLDVEDFEQTSFNDMKQSNFLVILDSLSDVGNIGAIARSAYALGAEGIIASGVRQLNFAGIARSSSGALFDIPFLVEQNPLSCINELQQLGFKLYGAAMDGVAVSDIEFSQKKVLVLGSEGEGISKRVKPKIDRMVSIPMQREFDSLNVSAAAAILLHRMNG